MARNKLSEKENVYILEEETNGFYNYLYVILSGEEDHCNENQTRGHVLLCMLALAIIKELENKLFPFLKEYNRTAKTQLSFNDLIAELKNIKMCELKIGEGVTSIMYPDLNPLQKKILQLLNINPDKMTM